MLIHMEQLLTALLLYYMKLHSYSIRKLVPIDTLLENNDKCKNTQKYSDLWFNNANNK
jgi:hypothetical protein